jgi:hypothetical protein
MLARWRSGPSLMEPCAVAIYCFGIWEILGRAASIGG